MGRPRKNKGKKSKGNKGLKTLKNLRKGGGGYLVRIYGDTATLRGSVVDNKNGLVSIKHKRPGLGVVLTIVAEENVVSYKPGFVVVKSVPVDEFFAVAIVRKDGVIYAKTLEGEKVSIPSNNVEITSTIEDEETEEEEEVEESEEDDDDKRKKKKKDEDEEEEEGESEEEDDDEPKKKKKDDDEVDEDWGI